MQVNVKRGFNRLFVVLTALWVVYCLFVYPIQRRQQADRVAKEEMRDCSEHNQDLYACLQYAEVKSGADMWSLKAYYSRESWFLVLVIVAVPALAYGLCRAVLAIGRWVWRGFRT
jgi:hypothetical protein